MLMKCDRFVSQYIFQEHYMEKKEICMYIDEHNIQQSPKNY